MQEPGFRSHTREGGPCSQSTSTFSPFLSIHSLFPSVVSPLPSSPSEPMDANPFSYINSSLVWRGSCRMELSPFCPLKSEPGRAGALGWLGLARGSARGPAQHWTPVQMEGMPGQCQPVRRIKTTHLFSQASRKATGARARVARRGQTEVNKVCVCVNQAIYLCLI